MRNGYQPPTKVSIVRTLARQAQGQPMGGQAGCSGNPNRLRKSKPTSASGLNADKLGSPLASAQFSPSPGAATQGRLQRTDSQDGSRTRLNTGRIIRRFPQINETLPPICAHLRHLRMNMASNHWRLLCPGTGTLRDRTGCYWFRRWARRLASRRRLVVPAGSSAAAAVSAASATGGGLAGRGSPVEDGSPVGKS